MEQEEVNTHTEAPVVPGNPAPEDEVTQVGNPASGEEVTQPKPTGTKATKLRVTDIERLLKYATVTDESPASVLTKVLNEYDALHGRIVDLVSTNEHLIQANTDIRNTLKEEQEQHEADYGVQVEEIGQLRARITTLENSAGTAVVPSGGQVSLDSFGSLGMKDIAEEIRDGCGGDEVCTATVLKLQQTRTEAMSKHLDRDHDAEQKRLDRDQKEDMAKKDREEKGKDRESRERQAEKERDNKLEMQLLKKGIVRKSFLEDAAFVNISSVPKRAKKAIAEKKTQAFHEAEDEEEYDYDQGEMTDEHTE